MPSLSIILTTTLTLYATLTTAKPPAAIHRAQTPHLTPTFGQSKAIASLTWGPMVQLGPVANGASIIGLTATSYPGNPPAKQAGGLFNWVGINNYDTDSDLIQSIVGQYMPGQSECEGQDEDELWLVFTFLETADLLAWLGALMLIVISQVYLLRGVRQVRSRKCAAIRWQGVDTRFEACEWRYLQLHSD